MPNPSEYDNENEWMSACVPTRIDEGDEQDQAVAACLGMWRDKDKARGEGMGQGGERQGDGGASQCVCPECGTEADKERGVPCAEMDCPQCGASMRGADETKQAWSLWQTVKGWFGRQLSPEQAEQQHQPTGAGPVADKAQVRHPFLVWKQRDGRYRWLAIYSNKFRDEDHPPEILAEAAHRDFVRAVDDGEWPMPELWLWHLPGTKSGAADMVAWDDNGFAVASGLFDEDKEDIGKALSLMGDLLTSHGMPVDTIERDTVDPSIITRYRSKEISPLPAEAAANKLTGFLLLSAAEDTAMALPKEKRGFLKKAGLDDEQIDNVEAMMADKAKSAEAAGLEFKDQDADAEAPDPEAPVEEPVEAKAGEADADAEPDPVEAKDADAEPEPIADPEPAPDYATREEVAQAFGDHLSPIVQEMQSLADQVQALTKQVSELRQEDEVKMAQMVEETPAASLTEMVGRAIGSDAAKIDGRSSLAKAGPEEADDSTEGPMAVPFLNQLLKQNQEYRTRRHS